MGNCLNSSDSSSVDHGKHLPFKSGAFHGESPSSSGDTHPTPSDSVAASVRSSDHRFAHHSTALILQNGTLQSSSPNFYNKSSHTSVMNGFGGMF